MSSFSRLAVLCATVAVIGLLGRPAIAKPKADAKDDIKANGTDPAESATAKAKTSTKGSKPSKAEPKKDDLWMTDFAAAQTKAKAEKKTLLLDFTGSDWCAWCIRLKKEVFNKDAFRKEAPKDVVCVELDFPQGKELPENLQKQNEKLQQKFKVEGFPTVLLLTPAGDEIARTGYQPGGPEAYVKLLKGFLATYQEFLVVKGKSEKAAGIDRAKLLDQMVELCEKLGKQGDELASWSTEIIALDSDNKAGLKLKYEFRIKIAEVAKLVEDEKSDEALAACDKLLALPGLSAQQKHEAYFAKSDALVRSNAMIGAVENLKLAQAADPKGPHADDIKSALAQFKEVAATVAEVAKLRKKLDKTTGLDRAKILDQLIDLYDKANDEGKQPGLWSAEIVKLDADNKGGLKQKHEVRLALAEIDKLAGDEKFDKAKAAVEKLLTRTDLNAAQKHEAWFTKARLLAADSSPDHLAVIAAVEAAQKADPKGKFADGVKDLLEVFRPAAAAAKDIAAIKPQLEKAEGLARAKLLDRMLDDQQALDAALPEPPPPAKAIKLCKEIIKLDPDNKAGLKQKSEIRIATLKADDLLNKHHADKALPVVDKALKAQGLTPEQLHELHFLRGSCFAGTGELQKALDEMDKALKAAPNGRRVSDIKSTVDQIHEALKADKDGDDDDTPPGKPAVPKKAGADKGK